MSFGEKPTPSAQIKTLLKSELIDAALRSKTKCSIQ